MKIPDLLRELKIPYREGGTHRHVRYGWVGCQCCWCGTSSWHLGIRLFDGYCSCWRCGRHRIGDVLTTITGRSWSDVRKLLDDLEISRQKPQEARGEFLRQGTVSVPFRLLNALATPQRRYLKGRGFNPQEIVDRWGIKGIGIDPPMSWRLWIPITLQGELVSWTTRGLTDKGSKYVSAAPEQERYPHKHILYGADKCRNGVIVHEGPLDVWSTGPGATCLFGLVWSDTQVAEIASYPIRVVCLDAEKDAQKRARRLYNELKTYPGITHIVELESGKDAGEADEEELVELRKLIE